MRKCLFFDSTRSTQVEGLWSKIDDVELFDEGLWCEDEILKRRKMVMIAECLDVLVDMMKCLSLKLS